MKKLFHKLLVKLGLRYEKSVIQEALDVLYACNEVDMEDVVQAELSQGLPEKTVNKVLVYLKNRRVQELLKHKAELMTEYDKVAKEYRYNMDLLITQLATGDAPSVCMKLEHVMELFYKVKRLEEQIGFMKGRRHYPSSLRHVYYPPESYKV